MQVARAVAYGGPEVLEVGRGAVPEPGDGEVLVRVGACGLGGWDVKRRAGAFGQDPAALPLVLGTELAGVVEAVGPGAGALVPGTRVFGYVPAGSGGNAALATARAEELAPAPARLSDAEAAAAPVGVLTAWQTLAGVLAVQPGEVLLVTGAAGGMGSFAVQLGRMLGARVVASARPAQHDALAALGAEAAVDAGGDCVAEARELAPDGVDAVLDCVGGKTFARAPDAVRDGGGSARSCPPRCPRSGRAGSRCTPSAPGPTPRSSRSSPRGWTPASCAWSSPTPFRCRRCARPRALRVRQPARQARAPARRLTRPDREEHRMTPLHRTRAGTARRG